MLRLATTAPAAAALIAIAFGMGSIAVASRPRLRYIVPVSGVLLAAVALLGLIPNWRRQSAGCGRFCWRRQATHS